MERFVIKEYKFGKPAQLYYPDREYSTASRRFREELLHTSGLNGALRNLNYKGNERGVTRSQVRTIVQYLSEP